MTVARVEATLKFIREQHFAHKFFELVDSNGISLVYANEDINLHGMDLHANTATFLVPDHRHGYSKFEFPDLKMSCLDIDCDVPKSTRGTLICDADLVFESESSLLNGDIIAVINESLVLPFNQVHDLKVFADPSSGKIELFF